MNDAYQPTGPSHTRGQDAHIPPVERLVSEFPNLEIQHLIGHGGMGAVYQARQLNLDRIIALKILSPKLGGDPAFAERFLREARTLARLSHPNIVTVFDFGQAGEFYYLTMEFVDGVNLRDTISQELLSPAEALAIIPQVCEALQYAHDSGVIHRDIKPENILITKGGNIKIADFGLAKLLQPNPDQFTLTGTRQVLGTMNYMAPEQIEKPDVVDHRADLYSLGVVFYELLTGELPLGRFSLPSEKSAAVSNRLDDVVMRTLEKDPNRRFQQASQIKTACESIDHPDSSDQRNTKNFNENHQPQNRNSTPTPPNVSTSAPLCRPFPITLEDLYVGLASGYGLLRGFESHLELEFEIRDFMDALKSDAKTVQIPLERIASIRLKRGFIYNHIEIQCDQIEVVSRIPSSKQGGFRVYLKKADLAQAELLVRRVDEMIDHTPRQFEALPQPPVKSGFFGRHRTHGSTVGTILTFLFLGLCGILGLSIILLSIYFTSFRRTLPVEQRSGQPEVRATAEQAATEVKSATGTTGTTVNADAGSGSGASIRAEKNREHRESESDSNASSIIVSEAKHD